MRMFVYYCMGINNMYGICFLKKNFIVEVFKFFIDEDGYKGVDFIVKVIFIFLENE